MFKLKIISILLVIFSVSCFSEVESRSGKNENPTLKEGEEIRAVETNEKDENLPETEIVLTEENKDLPNQNPAQKKPVTVKDYFMLLPEKYFSVDCCQGSKKEYLKQYLTVEDNKNGFLDGGGDGAQSTFKMALFKRPDKTYIIALNVFGEAQDDYFFLDYNNGTWKDISSAVIPQYDKMKIYEIPRYGTTMPVFAKQVIDSDGENDLTEKGKKLYDLVWKNGKFTIKN
jgi:hypothetical protein